MANPTQSTVIAAISLNPWQVDKSTNESLSAGTVYFWQDNNRSVPKIVYQQVQVGSNPATYTYVPLSDPLILSGVGTFVDTNGNEVAVYYYPFAEDDETIELYYITVYDSNGLLQYTREAWPPLAFVESEAGLQGIAVTNQISNSQFVDVNFIPATGLSYTYSGSATTTIAIAPDWDLNITHTGAGTITVDQTAIVGSSALPNNPPFTLEISPGSNITRLTLTQVFTNNPDWGAPQSNSSDNAYVASTIMLSANTSVTMNYIASSGASGTQVLLVAGNATSSFETFNATVALAPADNPEAGDTGYDTIELVLPTSGTYSLSNVQVVTLSANIANIAYSEDTSNRQRDYLFHYYNPLLQYKPINSYLIGWDFPFNPAQALGNTIGQLSTGANTSNYIWDQTIVFQSVNQGFTTSRAADGSLLLNYAITGQLALIQYLEQSSVRSMLLTRLSSMIKAAIQSGSTVGATVSLYYTTDASLPDMGSNLSLVATLDANGKPATFHGNWTEIARSNLGDARFDIENTTNNTYNLDGFSGWESIDAIGADTAKFFAIVVGTESAPNGTELAFNSISVVPGDIPTIPAPKTISETLQDCERYYRKSFAQGTKPAQAIGVGSGEIIFLSFTVGGAGGNRCQMIPWDPVMRAQPVVTFYNPNAANALACSEIAPYTDCATTSVYNNAAQALGIEVTNGAFTSGFPVGVHYTANAMLGVV